MTAKSETVGVVAVQRWECRPLNWEVQYHHRDDGEWVKFTDHESALAEAEETLSRFIAGSIEDTLTIDQLTAERERLISGLEALAGEWEKSGTAAGYPGDPEFIGAQKERLLDCAAELRALIPAAAKEGT